MPKRQTRYFCIDGESAKLVSKKSAPGKLPRRRTSIRIGAHAFLVHDAGVDGKIAQASSRLFDIPLCNMLFEYPIVLASHDASVLEMTEAKLRQLILDHIDNPDLCDEDDGDKVDDPATTTAATAAENDPMDEHCFAVADDTDTDDDDDDAADDDDDDDEEEDEEEEEEEEPVY